MKVGAGASSRTVLSVVAVVLCLAPLTASAQTAADVTPSTFAPEPRPLRGTVEFTGAPGLGVPDGADRLTITIRAVDIDGAFAEMAEAHRAATARLTGQMIPVSEIFLAAQGLEAAYAEAGYILARVVLPQQELRDGGTLRLVVVNGFVEAIEADALPDPVRGRITRVAGQLEGQQSLRLREIERALLIAGDTFGVALDSALAQGTAPGATRLVLGGEFRPVTGFAGLDSTQSSDLGGYALNAGVEFNSLLGWAETVYFRASGNPSRGGTSGGPFSATPRMRTLAAGVLAPIGTDGLTWNLEVTESRTTPQTDAVPTTSTFSRASFRLAYPVVRSRELNVTARVSFDTQRDLQDILGFDGSRLAFYRDDLRILRLSAGMTRSLPEGGLYAMDGVLSVGIDALGARSGTPDLPLSRDGARPGFSKLELSAQTVRPLGEQLVMSFTGRAQTAFGRPLVASEQIGITNLSELSGFSAGTESGDSGLVLRGELRAPFQSEQVQAVVTPYGFAAVGTLWLHQPTELEERSRHLSSFGVGVELLPMMDSRFTSASIRAEAARGIRHGGGPNDNRFSLVGSIRF